MNCQLCQAREASVQFTEVIGEQKRSHWLCNECAHGKGLYLSVQWQQESAAGSDPTQLRCDLCGSSLAAIRRSGRVGCPRCYERFANFLEPLLQRVHGRTRHAQGGDDTARDERRRLRLELQQALEHEDFDLAARLRDRLFNLARGDRGRP